MAKKSGDQFEPGDIVVLRCGGPRMVVSRRVEKHFDLEPGVHGLLCHWTVQSALREAVFAECELTLAPQEKIDGEIKADGTEEPPAPGSGPIRRQRVPRVAEAGRRSERRAE